jgi:iron complex transport system substrate-binding protein
MATFPIMRIASLLASATEMVCALDLEGQLVAISHECDYPTRVLDRPRVSRARVDPAGLSSGAIDGAVRDAMARFGSMYELDEAALKLAAPDLILAQELCEVCAVPTSLARQAAAALERPPAILSLDAHTIADIIDSMVRIGDAAGAEARAARVVEDLRTRLDVVRRAVAGRPRPRVLALEWLDPVFAPGHWIPEMVEQAGGECLLGTAGERSTVVDGSRLTGLDPDVLLVIPCGYGLARARADANAHAAALHAVGARAIAAGRAWVADASAYFNRSGPRVVDGVEILGRLLHPAAFPNTDLRGRAERWVPVSGGAG